MKPLLLYSAILFSVISSAFSQTEITAFNSSDVSNITRVVQGPDNTLYLAGYFSGNWTVNSKTYTKDKGSSQFICKMDASDKITWFIQTEVTVLDMQFFNDNLYVLGQYKGSGQFLTGLKTSAKNNIMVCSVSSGGTLNWISGPDSNTDDIYGDGISLDPQGNIYLLGSFESTISYGSKSLNKIKEKNAFITKLDKNGKVQWLSQMTGGDSYITGLWTDAICYSDSDHIFVTGYLLGPCTFGSKTITTKTYKFTDGELYSSTVFVATYNNKGVCNDVESFITEASVNQITTDSSGNIILSGYFKGNVTDVDYATSYFGTTAVKTTIDSYAQSPSEDSYVAKFTSAGQLLWVAHGMGSSCDRVQACSVAPDGSIYACGFYHVDMSFTGKTKKTEVVNVIGTDESKYNGDIYAVKLSSDGELIWFKTGGSTGTDTAWDLAANSTGVTVVGAMTGNAVFDKVSKQMVGKYRNGVIIKI